ncbi:metalloproteinase inhibitor 3-like [Argopecten irradians]|uniref:metalloproteinase inhibitor 3-like n=1 Tax=Argopecten irradians TaxID=31199 RepID=UPI0037133B5A
MCPDKIHPQDAFCSSDFVMRTTVTDITMVGDDPETADLDPQIKYNIIIDKVFKEPSVPSVEATCVVESLTSNATVGCFFSLCTLEQCSVQLDVDQTYLISGFVVDGQLKIDECGLHIPWEEVTSHMKIGLNKRYPNNCQCSTGEDKCIIDPPPTDICFCQYASCVEVQKEGCAPECKWKKSNTFKSCVQQATSPPL